MIEDSVQVETQIYAYSVLNDFCTEVFLYMGCSLEDATLASKVLLSADLRGVDSHGVARLSGYLRLWEQKRINAKPNIKIIYETPSTATIDGDAGLGLVVAPKSMDVALDKAQKVGSGWVSVQNSNHFGIAGYHSMMALPLKMIGVSMTNASPLVAPTFSVSRMLGTNPISVAIPALHQDPFVADFATTTAANGKLEILQRKSLDAPLGWIQNKEGEDTTNPHALKEGGALLPLGSDYEHGSHKGYCLGAMVDILTGVLSGANFGPWVPPFVSFLPVSPNPVGKGLGHFLGALSIDGFQPKEAFLTQMDLWINTFKNAESITGKKVLIPGEIEKESEIYRLKNGIPLLRPVEEDLKSIASKIGYRL